MDDQEETWQRRIRELYANVEELYSHVDITIVVFDRGLVEVSAEHGSSNRFGQLLADVARRVFETGEAQRDVACDPVGRQRAHAFPLRDGDSIVSVVCVVDDDGARRELFVRCAMAIFDGYRQKEASLLERERRALEEAQRANQLRDQFMAVIAHELRSPLASILLWEQVLRNPDVDSATRASALDAIHESANGQALLVADLLDVSRAINGKLHIDRRLTSIARVLTLAIETARPHAAARGLEIVSQLDPTLGDVLGDSRRLRQILDNLLSNAIKCTERGRITVRARQSDDSITIDLRDTGRGIAPAFLPHVFDPFRQANEGGPGDGLGLGLGIARQLVELHGGTLSASSEGLGHGAELTVILPRARTSARTMTSSQPLIASARVLIVDDDTRMAEALQLLLQSLGAIVTTAQSAATAFPVLLLGDIDIVLSDIGMAGEDGYSFVQRIRATSGGLQSIPAIAITARVADDTRQRAFAAGFDRYLTKPIDIGLLVSEIADLVRR